ncbi:MAG: hypothetical protein L0216_20250 [Planctomycetales bacterium]|nr:hypothetical protein [Planctomycetales bacterium]
MTTRTREITPKSTMGEVLETYPSAKRALFQAYHIGGCHSCGYELGEALENVCASHGLEDVSEVIEFIKKSQEQDDKVQVSAREVAEMVRSRVPFKFLDVRSEEEWQVAKISGAQLVTEQLVQEIMTSWPKDTTIVVHCHHGMRSLDAASYLIGHGFQNVRSLAGGIDAWSREVDPTVPTY